MPSDLVKELRFVEKQMLNGLTACDSAADLFYKICKNIRIAEFLDFMMPKKHE